MGPGLDLEWVKDFLAVAARRSFTGAARARGLSQPSLSRRIQSLETWLGADLFDRQRTPLNLTPAGVEFREKAPKILDLVRDTRHEVSKGEDSTIPIYTLETLAATFVPTVLRTIRQALGDTLFEIKVSIFSGDVVDCVEAIAYEAAPFMIVYENAGHRINLPRGFSEERLDRVVIARDRLVPVCGSDSYDLYLAMMNNQEKLPLSNYSKGSFLEELVLEKLAELGLGDRVEPVDFAPSADTLRNLVRENQGIAWVLNSTAENALGGDVPEIKIFDFGLKLGPEVDLYIDLDIVMFRAREFSSPTIRRSMLDDIWRAAQSLRDELSPERPPTGAQG